MITSNTKKPAFRKLKGYAFDPSLSNKIDTAIINHIIYKVDWEDHLAEGPSGEYLEVIDYDPTIQKFYTPVNLNDPYILAQDGLDPSESNPKFHQQMVYAVAMTTIKNFENALGRPILWNQRILAEKSPVKRDKKKKPPNDDSHKYSTEFVQKLRVYPHAFRDANAYYSPQKRALLFGYFSSQPADVTIQMPDSQIFTCLSHDIIAHETTHAILDGIYSNYTDDTNPDMLSFHEAFADIVALFQHFTFPDVLKNQIAKTKGDLSSQNLLGELAQQFGSAIGGYGALRDAIGSIDPVTRKWRPKEPSGDEYQTEFEPHARGAILVSAVFDAFITIYKNRVADLLRIATGGSGVLPEGELHPDLVNRLAGEAAKSAGHILKMCIRALDYCPPVDITFGDYLRAIITADTELVADDSRDYRLAFIDAFRKRGIYPDGIKSLSVESLCYLENDESKLDNTFIILTRFLRQFSGEIIYADSQELLGDAREIYDDSMRQSSLKPTVSTSSGSTRERIYNITRDYIVGKYEGVKHHIYGLHRRIYEKFDGSFTFQKITGLAFGRNWDKLGVNTSHSYGSQGPSFWIHSLQLASRVGPTGNKSNQIILSLVQKAGIEIIENADGTKKIIPFVPHEDFEQTNDKFIMTGGATLIFDLDSLKLKYAISKPLIDVPSAEGNSARTNEKRALNLYHYFNTNNMSAFNVHFSPGRHNSAMETFSFLHTD